MYTSCLWKCTVVLLTRWLFGAFADRPRGVATFSQFHPSAVALLQAEESFSGTCWTSLFCHRLNCEVFPCLYLVFMKVNHTDQFNVSKGVADVQLRSLHFSALTNDTFLVALNKNQHADIFQHLSFVFDVTVAHPLLKLHHSLASRLLNKNCGKYPRPIDSKISNSWYSNVFDWDVSCELDDLTMSSSCLHLSFVASNTEREFEIDTLFHVQETIQRYHHFHPKCSLRLLLKWDGVEIKQDLHRVFEGRVCAERVMPCALASLALELVFSVPTLITISEWTDAFPLNNYVNQLSTFGYYEDQELSSVRPCANLSNPITQLRGGGEVIAIADTGLDLRSCFFRDDSVTVNMQTTLQFVVLNPNHRKVLQYVNYADNVDDENGHGTHVCGTASGQISSLSESDESTQREVEGLAPDAKISFFDIGRAALSYLLLPDDIHRSLLNVQYASGARVFSFSWGSKDSSYSLLAAQVDAFMWMNADALVVIAAGNFGHDGRYSVTSPSTSKSCLSIGASSSDYLHWKRHGWEFKGLTKDSVAYFSSWGPTRDGRIKPEVVAPGYYTTSAASNGLSSINHCGTRLMAGTSMSTPAVAALASRIREYFLRGFYPFGMEGCAIPPTDSVGWSTAFDTPYCDFIPSGALLKALLIHSAEEMHTLSSTSQFVALKDYPSVIQGFGRVNLANVLFFASRVPRAADKNWRLFVVGSAFKYQDNLFVAFQRQGEVHKYQLIPTLEKDSNSWLRVTICFTDYPGQPLSTIVSVNRLSLRVVQIASNGHQSVSLPLESANILSSSYQTVQVVCVRINSDTTSIVAEVAALQLVVGPQTYALVATGTFFPLSHQPNISFDDSSVSEKHSSNTNKFNFLHQTWEPFWLAVVVLAVLSGTACLLLLLFVGFMNIC